MANKTDISDEIEFWALIQEVETNKTVITLKDTKNILGNSEVV
jgi:hypothetical protein